MRLHYRQRVFLYFSLIFVVFSVAIIAIEQYRQVQLKRRALITQLGLYVDVIQRAALSPQHGYQPPALEQLLPLLPPSIRVSILDDKGKLLYDNAIVDLSQAEDHSARPEIRAARGGAEGQDIRRSQSNGQEYFYLARAIGHYYVRVALPYDHTTQAVLQADKGFVYWMIACLLLMLLVSSWVSGYLARAIERLRRLALRQTDEQQEEPFPDDELGEISRQIISHYQTLNRQSQRIAMERERLLQHILSLQEGIGFVDHRGAVFLFNAPFLQYLSSIGGRISSSPDELLADPSFEEVRAFLQQSEVAHYERSYHSHGRIYALRVNRLCADSYEILIQDVTEAEQMRVLKREMTSNIAHELRTPVTSLRAYLETCLSNDELSDEMRSHFLRQSYAQTLLLSDLIRDIGMLSQIEAGSEHFLVEEVSCDHIYQRLLDEFAQQIAQQAMQVEWHVPQGQTIRGNAHLLYAIFRNLMENSLRYAGQGVSFVVQLYRQDEHRYYFSVHDTGVGIEEQHLTRIFERFYRCSAGRTRQSGGTGLGLSIVKNAVLFHRGDITVKNRQHGGLEFLFYLRRL